MEACTTTEHDDESKVACSVEELCTSQGYDLKGNPVAWDLSTQDGRWLHWRDMKVRKGQYRSMKKPELAELDRRYPYDPRRPAPVNLREHRDAHELCHVITAPYPMNKVTDITSTETAIDAGILKPWAADAVNRPHEEKPSGKSRDRPSSKRKSKSQLQDAIMTMAASRSATQDARQAASMNTGAQRLERRLQSDISRLDARSLIQATLHSRPQTGTADPRALPADKCHTSMCQKLRNRSRAYDNVTDGDGELRSKTACTSSECRQSPAEQISYRSEHEKTRSLLIDISSTPKDEEIRDDQSEDMPVTAFIRCRRLAYFAEKEKREAGTDGSPKELDTPRNIAGLMQDAGMTTRLGHDSALDSSQSHLRRCTSSITTRAKSTDTRPSPSSPKAYSPNSHLIELATLDQTMHTVPVAAAPSELEGSAVTIVSELPVAAAPSELEGSATTLVLEPPQVPLTLLPDMSSEERPRDEDPRIMPIPRMYNFAFDPRQLRDLAVIKEGGNGCAIDGYEFEVYENDGEGEWIGSGLTGSPFPTRGISRAGNSHGLITSKTNDGGYEVGRGDEEGLLNELPGL
ncbi:uncharacterized protein AB675_4843 [Cyphellophora attinorum]|uniref:Uncharacterized protein n=1 Tax=Cyphellophora attinorum TaxID=1664694 RepID=A0A0N1H1R3_9EURO|nr:uncharacterized protein AB675_4843 [Phialophora attinorum]KPI34853.1 hypothetical protein AB675_4843 [Phialophora attinorum]